MRKLIALSLMLIAANVSGAAAPAEMDPSRIDVYVTPYYRSEGPAINIGPFSPGLASKADSEFLSTIAKMKREWSRLTFIELYVAAIRLYDRGYRDDATYWFYVAQYRGRQFGTLMDQASQRAVGNPAFELLQAHNAFYQLTRSYFMGYSLRDPSAVAKVVQRVQTEERTITDLRTIYPNVTFIDEGKWQAKNVELAEGMNQLLTMLKDQKDLLKKQRIDSGVEATFSKLTSKRLPRR